MRGITKQRKTEIETAKKDRLVKAVLRIFEKRQPKKLTVDMITRESGLSKSTLYRCFSDKDELITYVMLKALEPYWQKNIEITDGDMTFVDKLKASAEVSLEGTEVSRDLFDLVFQSVSVYSKKPIKAINEKRFRNISRIKRLMRQGLQQGILAEAGESTLALFLAGLIRYAYAMRSILPKEAQQSFAKDAETIVEKFLYGVGRERANAKAQ